MEKKYKLEITEYAMKQLHKLGASNFATITSWLSKNLENCTNPRAHGKPLKANHSGEWRYRIGDYRVIAQIDDEKVIILVLCAGHRREIYK